jgi:hypothetical protein
MNRATALSFDRRHLPDPGSPGRQQSPPSTLAIRNQLSKILQSDGFIRAARMRRFLKFVVEEALVGRANLLCEYSIGISVYERDESFDPALDPIVRNDARRLRQKLLEYYQQSSCGYQVIIDVPKGGYAPVFRAAQNPEETIAPGTYRLVANLIRLDGTSVWNIEQDFQLSETKDEPGFKLQFRVERR